MQIPGLDQQKGCQQSHKPSATDEIQRAGIETRVPHLYYRELAASHFLRHHMHLLVFNEEAVLVN